jgi:hypothetical protein
MPLLRSAHPWPFETWYMEFHPAATSGSLELWPRLVANVIGWIAPWLYHDCTMIVPRLYHDCTMIVPWLYHDCTMIVPRLYHDCHDGISLTSSLIVNQAVRVQRVWHSDQSWQSTRWCLENQSDPISALSTLLDMAFEAWPEDAWRILSAGKNLDFSGVESFRPRSFSFYQPLWVILWGRNNGGTSTSGEIPWIRESNVRLTADERWLKITLFVDLVHFLTQLLDVSLNLIKLIQFWIQWTFPAHNFFKAIVPIFCPPFVADKLHIVIQSVAHFDASWRILPCGGCQAQLDL